MRHEVETETSSMEPCIDASPSKEEKKKMKKSEKKKLDKKMSTVSSPKEETEAASIPIIGSSQSLPTKVRSPLHESDKTHPLHSAASTRDRRPFFLHRLSSSVGSKQRRQRKRELKKQRRQSEFVEQRHEEEIKSRNSLSPRGDFVVSPSSTVHSSKSNASRRRRGKQAIKVIRRALSSPPILLQRFGSNPDQRGDASEHGRWQENENSASRRILPCSSSSSNSSGSTNTYDLNRVNLNLAERTRVIPKAFSPAAAKKQKETMRLKEEEELKLATKANCSATSILHHSYFPVFESLCGSPHLDIQNDPNNMIPPKDSKDLRNSYYNNTSCLSISEDPTVQESIECIFASQLEDGLKLWDEEYDDEDNNNNNDLDGVRSFASLERVSSSTRDELISPASVQQSRMNRKDRKDSSKSLLFANMSQTKKRYEQASLVYVGTFDPNTPRNRVPSTCSSRRSFGRNQSMSYFSDEVCCHDTSTVYSNLPEHPLPCACATSVLPSVQPKDWPQAPLALRPTPGRGMKIKAIRFSNSSEPLWVPGSHLTWSQRLEQHWGRQTEEELRKKRDLEPRYACCEECVILPVNNGNEKPGESLVVDFESELFEGTFLLRLRHTNGTTPDPYDDTKGYFKGMNRRYQACIRGRFKKALPFTELTTGFKLDRTFGKLPSKWVLKGALKVVSFFAPQLDIKLEGVEQPYSVTPLGSTPQCINVDDKEDEEESKTGGYSIQFSDNYSSSSDEEKSAYVNTIEDSNARMNPLEGIRVESSEARRSLLGMNYPKETTSLQRAKMRKKAFDKLYREKSPDPKTDPSKIYTFEFLQHMLNFQDFTIDLGNMLGSVKLEDLLDGQALPIMACYGDKVIWSFDVWNECLWEQAQYYDAIEKKNRAAAAN